MADALTYSARAGDTFDGIALTLYGHERYTSELLRANPSLCRVMTFAGGEKLTVPVIYVPDINEDDENNAPIRAPWKD